MRVLLSFTLGILLSSSLSASFFWHSSSLSYSLFSSSPSTSSQSLPSFLLSPPPPSNTRGGGEGRERQGGREPRKREGWEMNQARKTRRERKEVTREAEWTQVEKETIIEEDKQLDRTEIITHVELEADVNADTGKENDKAGVKEETERLSGVTCKAWEFKCADGEQCIPENDTCNSVMDCRDQSDEGVQQCGCPSHKFQCGQECIVWPRRCDTIQDCQGGEDEQGCESYTCLESYFTCGNHYCVPETVRCNHKDECGDKSDEVGCNHQACGNWEFDCEDTTQCIPPGFICDGKADCYEGSDERQCSHDDFIVCNSGLKVHRQYWCDNFLHCLDDHQDENNCTDDCAGEKFRCNSGRCLDEGYTCDGYCDCLECEDEENHECHNYYTKHSGVIKCIVGKSVRCEMHHYHLDKYSCVQEKYICDGHRHCRNGDQTSDETGCNVGESECLERKSEGKRSHLYCPAPDGRCLAIRHWCDGAIDCLGGEDEHDCGDVESCGGGQLMCDSGLCYNATNKCDLDYHCTDYSDEMHCEDHVCGPDQKQCRSGQCLDVGLWCDHWDDCWDGSDEDNCDSEYHDQCLGDVFRCADGKQCIPSHLNCMVMTYGNRSACRDESHIYNCSDNICPDGMYQCGTGPCLPESNCDGNVDCPETWDDQNDCPYNCSRSLCFCKGKDANCSGYQLDSFPDIYKSVRNMFLANNNLGGVLQHYIIEEKNYNMFLKLDLSNNNIERLKEKVFVKLISLTTLLLTNNRLTAIHPNVFEGLYRLDNLDLNGNQLSTLHEKAFNGLHSLHSLDLSHQNLSSIHGKAFVSLDSLTRLNLSHNELLHRESIDPRALSPTHLGSLRILATDSATFCCSVNLSQVDCTPQLDDFSSCTNLMDNWFLLCSIWVVGFLAFIGNTFVIIRKARDANQNKKVTHLQVRSVHVTSNGTPHQITPFLVMNLAVSDWLMGVYLLIIAGVDQYYRGHYVLYEHQWRMSWFCQVTGFISFLSSEASVFTLAVIAVNKLNGVRNNMSFGRVRTRVLRTIRAVMMGVWTVALTLAGVPIFLGQHFDNFYGRSGVCLALPITKNDEEKNGRLYSVIVFIALNLIMFIIMAVSYVLIIKQIQENKLQNVKVNGRRRNPNKNLAIIIATDAMCWLPIITMGISSLCGVHVHPKMYSYVAVFVLPINSAINPLLYTLMTDDTLKRKLTHMRRSLSFSNLRKTSTTRVSLSQQQSPCRPGSQVNKAAGLQNEDGQLIKDIKNQTTKPKDTNTQPTKTKETNTQPTKTKDTNTQPTKTKNTNTQPTKTKDTNTQPNKTKNTNTQPTKTKHTNTHTTKTRDMISQPTKTKDTNTQPTKTKDTNTQPTKTKDTNTQPTKTMDTNTQPTKTKDTNTHTTKTKPMVCFYGHKSNPSVKTIIQENSATGESSAV